MKTAIDAIRRLHDHRVWARTKAIGLLRAIPESEHTKPFPMGPGSLLGVLVHCHGAEVVWLNVLEGVDPATNIPGVDAFAGLAALEAAWRPIDDRWSAWWSRLSPEDLDRPAVRRREGRDLTTSVAEVLLHVCTHQHYHLAQIVNMLRQLGRLGTPVPSLDLITMARERWTARA